METRTIFNHNGKTGAGPPRQPPLPQCLELSRHRLAPSRTPKILAAALSFYPRPPAGEGEDLMNHAAGHAYSRPWLRQHRAGTALPGRGSGAGTLTWKQRAPLRSASKASNKKCA